MEKDLTTQALDLIFRTIEEKQHCTLLFAELMLGLFTDFYESFFLIFNIGSH